MGQAKNSSTILSQGEPLYLSVYFSHMCLCHIFALIHAISGSQTSTYISSTWLLRHTLWWACSLSLEFTGSAWGLGLKFLPSL